MSEVDNLGAALRWTIEDSRQILSRVNLILIDGSSSTDEFHQILEEQVREHLAELLGKDYKDCLVGDVLRLCEESARDKGSFLQVSTTATDRTLSDDEGGEDDDDDDEIHRHLVIRSCDDGNLDEEEEEEEDAEICSICLENLRQRGTNTATLKCWHEYHVDCIKKWFLGGRRFCPLCKKDATRHVGAR